MSRLGRQVAALAAVGAVWAAAGAVWASLAGPGDARPILTAVPDRVVIAGPEERSPLDVPSPVPRPHVPSSDSAPSTVPAPSTTSRPSPLAVCEATIAARRRPPPPGWTETCGTLPDRITLGMTYSDRRIVYNTVELATRPPGRRAYVVEHEWCHAWRIHSGAVDWGDVAGEERAADECAAAHGASLRWSPYR